jgi:antibiotic biosynthesis monooxygenase (ABM) superfamily enzyme
MWIRSGFWIGTPRDEAAFRAAVDAELMPMLRALPGVRGADALWPQRREDGAPPIACQMLVHIESAEAIDRMLASPERTVMRARVLEVLAGFDGIISHIDYELA